MKNATRLLGIVALVLVVLAAAFASATETVSPGAVDRLAVVETRCPTFSWGMDSGAVAYDLVAYILPDDTSQPVELTSETEVLYAAVPGGATSWTPSAEKCFAPGGRYVWFVRAASELAGDQVIEAGEWSVGRYFSVPAAPSDEEMQRALDVLRRWDAANGDGSPTLSSAAVAVPVSAAVSDADAGTDAGSAAPESIPTAPAAIRGHHPLLNGIAYGVVGTTTAAGGAGIAAAHLEGGADLVLDGSVDGQADTKIYEWGLERVSPADETFRFRNTGSGAMTVDVDGTIAATGLDCPGCVTSAALAGGAVGSDALHDNGVTTAKIAGNAVTSVKIQDGQIREVDLGTNAVTSDKIEAGAVTFTKIADGAVVREKIRDDAVTTDKIDDGTITAADIDATSSIYVSKSQLYEREESIVLGTLGMLSAEVFCDDSNDLPLVGWCTVSNNNMSTRIEEAIDWGNTADPAGWKCLFFLEISGVVTGDAHILCISVP